MIVQSQSAKKAILAALADEEMTKILDSVMYHSKSIVDITRENDIPHTTCYRKTKWLLNEGLVIVDKIIITPEGKKFSLYQVHHILYARHSHYDSYFGGILLIMGLKGLVVVVVVKISCIYIFHFISWLGGDNLIVDNI